MKKMLLAMLIFPLLMIATFVNILKAGATTPSTCV